MLLPLLVIGLASILILVSVTVPFSRGVDKPPPLATSQWVVWLGVIFCSCIYVWGRTNDGTPLPGYFMHGRTTPVILSISTLLMMTSTWIDRTRSVARYKRDYYQWQFRAIWVSMIIIYAATVLKHDQMPELDVSLLVIFALSSMIFLGSRMWNR